ncbi:hypothetical protein [Yinghuangia soli]|nr:hypothetical protein [Yinghuangia soli]
MTEAYDGATGEDYDRLVDSLAEACVKDAPERLAAMFAREEFTVG